MKEDREARLNRQMDEELDAMADARERLLMEMEELHDIEMPEEKLEDILRELETRKKAAESSRKPRARIRMAVALAAVLILLVGAGAVGSGAKLYVPEIFQRSRGNETKITVNNTDATALPYDEKEVRQEIKEKLGMVMPNLVYQPQGMQLREYEIYEDDGEAFMRYEYAGDSFYIMIDKKYIDSSSQWETDGEVVDTLTVMASGIEVPVYGYKTSSDESYFATSFEYLNTCYYITGMMEQEEFMKILENLLIKSD